MAFTVPSTWAVYKDEGDQVTYTRPGHSVQQPRLAMVNRTVASFDIKRGLWSTPKYRVRVFDGVLDAKGNPDPTRTYFDLTCSSSLNSDGFSRADEVLADGLAIVNQADFVAAAYQNQKFPTIAAS